MEMIEVDPKLFVICRLCLEDMGQYQIAPPVQDQIKFCFDITVKPFDGLPQLICKKCSNHLNTYHDLKINYIEKQKTLKEKINAHKVPPTAEKTSEKESQEVPLDKVIASEPTTDNIDSPSSSSVVRSDKKASRAWEASYTKLYVCRYCQKCFNIKKQLNFHTKTHNKAALKCNKAMQSCLVRLEKIDKKTNFTCDPKTVAFSKDKVLKYAKHTDYIVCFVAKDSVADLLKDGFVPQRKVPVIDVNSDSEGEVSVSKAPKKRRRLVTTSSTETIVIETEKSVTVNENNEMDCGPDETIRKEDLKQVECINIEDSDTESFIGMPDIKDLSAKEVDQRTIMNIINLCQSRFTKKYKNAGDSEDLKIISKIMSIGRKTLNKQGFNCTGFLRFMECKNVHMCWTAIPGQKQPSVQIQTRKKQYSDKNVEETGWARVEETKYDDTLVQRFFFSNDALSNCINNLASTSTAEILPANGPAASSVNDTKKILNENPVANPKQLPKKTNLSENKQNNIGGKNEMSHLNDNILFRSPVTDSSDSMNIDTALEHEMNPLPIITSTKSLAVSNDENVKTVPPKDNEAAIAEAVAAPPRIKVKSVTELMPPKPLMDQQQSTNIVNMWNANHNLSSRSTSQGLQYYLTHQHKGPDSNNRFETQNNLKNEMLILNTVELPNSKTNSPLRYFKDLLLIHNIKLKDQISTAENYVSLLKFKLVLRQENSESVVLCIQIFCHQNEFCIKVRNSETLTHFIDISTLSANWQWEILKQIGQDHVVAKLLQSAQKRAHDLYTLTSQFLRLLKSIECKKDVS